MEITIKPITRNSWEIYHDDKLLGLIRAGHQCFKIVGQPQSYPTIEDAARDLVRTAPVDGDQGIRSMPETDALAPTRLDLIEVD